MQVLDSMGLNTPMKRIVAFLVVVLAIAIFGPLFV